jgi:hypothetical protein
MRPNIKPTVAPYAATFKGCIDEVEARVVPIRVYNVARAATLLENELVNAVSRFRGKLEFDNGTWVVKFPDGTSYTPIGDALKLLRRRLDRSLERFAA